MRIRVGDRVALKSGKPPLRGEVIEVIDSTLPMVKIRWEGAGINVRPMHHVIRIAPGPQSQVIIAHNRGMARGAMEQIREIADHYLAVAEDALAFAEIEEAIAFAKKQFKE